MLAESCCAWLSASTGGFRIPSGILELWRVICSRWCVHCCEVSLDFCCAGRRPRRVPCGCRGKHEACLG
eukprot:5359379-Alexandrium_andersonii.AAC.1